jgi:hypothetical protein
MHMTPDEPDVAEAATRPASDRRLDALLVARAVTGTPTPADSGELRACGLRSASGSGGVGDGISSLAAVGIVSPRASGSRSTSTAQLRGPLRDSHTFEG